MVQQRTWPYGTVKKVKVLSTDVVKHNDQSINVTLVYDESEKESYIRVGDKSGAAKNDVGNITFKQGGPTGGMIGTQVEVHA